MAQLHLVVPARESSTSSPQRKPKGVKVCCWQSLVWCKGVSPRGQACCFTLSTGRWHFPLLIGLPHHFYIHFGCSFSPKSPQAVSSHSVREVIPAWGGVHSLVWPLFVFCDPPGVHLACYGFAFSHQGFTFPYWFVELYLCPLSAHKGMQTREANLGPRLK